MPTEPKPRLSWERLDAASERSIAKVQKQFADVDWANIIEMICRVYYINIKEEFKIEQAKGTD